MMVAESERHPSVMCTYLRTEWAGLIRPPLPSRRSSGEVPTRESRWSEVREGDDHVPLGLLHFRHGMRLQSQCFRMNVSTSNLDPLLSRLQIWALERLD